MAYVAFRDPNHNKRKIYIRTTAIIHFAIGEEGGSIKGTRLGTIDGAQILVGDSLSEVRKILKKYKNT
ncbi:MAG TPA: hypothetical protein VJX23_10355 [Candidatus Binataceae bacterium]|nr:hypothetical protein [Candidatus Binataceae bacterium]